MAKSYEQDQKEFIRALKQILGSNYQNALIDAKEANRAMARHAKAHGVDSVPQYIKDQKEAAKNRHAQRNNSHSQNRQAANRMQNIKANPGNFTSNKVPANQGYSLNAELEKTYRAKVAS